MTNAVTQAPLPPPQVLISLAPPAEPPHGSHTGDTPSPRPAVLGVSSPNPPGCPAAPERLIPDRAVAVPSPCSRSRWLGVTGRVSRGERGLALRPALAQRLASPLRQRQRRCGLGRVYNTRR